MSTRNEFVPLKKQLILPNVGGKNQYSNLTLNQSHKCSNGSFVQLNSKLISNNKGFDIKIDEKRNLWNKSSSSNNLHTKPFKSFAAIHEAEKTAKTKRWKNDSSDSNPTSNSTLSLHIAAYEDSVENGDTVSLDKHEGLTKNLNNGQKQRLINLARIQNPFEFPRQQTDDKTDPAVMQFTASQQLLNPNQLGSSNDNQQRTQNIGGSRTALVHFNQSPPSPSAQIFGTGKKMSQNRKFEVYCSRSITPEDKFFPQEILSQHVNYSLPSTIEGSTCEVATKENESLISAAERIRELFFTRTELISRALSGSYILTREEALDYLREQYDATKDPKLEKLLHFPWDSLPVRFRKVVNRSRAKISSFIQAELRFENQSGVYFYYFNFISCDYSYPSFTRYSYVVAIESSEKGGFVQAYFALTCPSNEDTSVLVFTDNFVRGIAHWIHSQKRANVNRPLSCVPSSYYDVLDDVRKHPAVHDLSNCWSQYERTNKAKHLYEDVGIVAYLATYWLSNGIKDIHFADIGCGNGVISYLLNTIYGKHIKGYGYDLKERRIWGYYKSKGQDVVKVQAILPNFPLLEQPFPPETNYIIGIHTDEMTPWLPLIAMKRKCNFFLLPCCPFDFFGRFVKRNKHNGDNNNEWEYFNYIVSLAETLGFDVKIDSLKIPSEKKTAIIGTIPSSGQLLCDYDPEWEQVVRRIMEPSFKANNSRGFQPRAAEIEVKNCTKIPVEARNLINERIADILRHANPEVGVSLKDIVAQLSDEEISYLKSQNGGIQTFIKNNRGAYNLNRGNVTLRNV